MINAKIDDKKCVVTLKGIENNAKNMNRAMRIIALEMEESVRENFEVGGRYSSPGSLLGGNHKWVKGKYGGSLIKTGNLRDSITSKSGDDFAQLWQERQSFLEKRKLSLSSGMAFDAYTPK